MTNKKCNEEVVKQVCKKVNKLKKNTNGVRTGATVIVDELTQKLKPDLFGNKANGFLKNIKRDYKRLLHLSKCCIIEQQEKILQNEQELSELKKKFNNIQVEDAEIKRKRWCRHCESEAKYLCSTVTSFYCSTECEQYQNNMFGVEAIAN